MNKVLRVAIVAFAITAFGSYSAISTVDAAVVGKLVASDSYNLYWGGSYQDESKAQGMYNTAFGKNTSAGVTADANYYGDIQTGSTGQYQFGMAWGKDAHAANNSATAFGYKTIASGVASTAFGEGTRATGSNATAFGQETKATNTYATAFGYRTTASGENATALGAVTTASGQSALAAGEETKATGLASTALGKKSEAHGVNSTALSGGIVNANAQSSTAIGYGARAEVSDTVALGSGSVANREAGVTGFKASDERSGAAWTSTANAISVGNTTAVGDDGESKPITRQIIGVSAGLEDTDAVNVAQLKAVVDDTRAAAEEQLAAVRKEVQDNGTVQAMATNQRFDSIESDVNTLGQRIDSAESGISAVNQRVSNLDSRVSKVGAGAAALAALHPVSGDGTKFGVAAGVGFYKGQKAVALGGSYSPNDTTTISVGGAMGNGENMVNAGVSVKVGAGNVMSKAQMNTQIKTLQAENHTLKARDAAQDAQLQALRAEIEALKASITK